MTPNDDRINPCTGPLQAHFLPLAFVAIYLALMIYIHRCLRPDQIFMIFIFTSVVMFGGKTGKRFIIDWAPFTVFLILYDGMRGIADNFGKIHVSQPYHLELSLTGWFTQGKVLPFLFQSFRSEHIGTQLINALDAISGTLYSFHFLLPFLFGWLLWSIYKDRREFYYFAYSLTILNLLALATFFLYPAAPPWYVWQHHFAKPLVGVINYSNAAALVNVDQLLQFPLFKSVWETMNPNAFAAIPSLHGAYPFLLTCFAFRTWKFWTVRVVFVIYTASVWFAACYLNHHYIVDLLIGAAYVGASLLIYKYLLGPFVIEPLIISKDRTRDSADSGVKNPIFATVVFVLGGVMLLASIVAYAIYQI